MARKKTRLRLVSRRGKRAAAAATRGANRSRGAAGKKRNRYDASYRQQVAEHSILHGIHAAAKKFGVSAPSVTTWRKYFGISRKTKKAMQAGKPVSISAPAASAGRQGRGYSADFRREVAEYSILNGIQHAAKKFKVSSPSVTNWRKSFGIDRRRKEQALAAASTGAAAAPRLGKAEKRDLKKHFDAFVKAFDRLIEKI